MDKDLDPAQVLTDFKLMYSTLVGTNSDEVLTKLIAQATNYVNTYNPPANVLEDLVLLYTAYILSGGKTSTASIKVNNIQVTKSDGNTPTFWLNRFHGLLRALGLNEAKVIGW